MDPATAILIGSGISAISGLAGGAIQGAGRGRQNRLSREASGRQAAQLDPFVDRLAGYDTSDLRNFDTSRMENFDTKAMQQYAAGLMGQGAPSASLGALNLPGNVNTGDLRDFSAQSLRASETGGLEAAAERQMERQSGRLDAALAARGIYNTGAGVRQQRQLTADVFGGLAEQINADQRAREQAALGLEQQALAEALGLDVTQRGQTVQARTQARAQDAQIARSNLQAQIDQQTNIAGLLSDEAMLRGDMLAQGRSLALRGLEGATNADLRALEGAAGLVASTPGYGYYDRETGKLYNQDGAFDRFDDSAGGGSGASEAQRNLEAVQRNLFGSAQGGGMTMRPAVMPRDHVAYAGGSPGFYAPGGPGRVPSGGSVPSGGATNVFGTSSPYTNDLQNQLMAMMG